MFAPARRVSYVFRCRFCAGAVVLLIVNAAARFCRRLFDTKKGLRQSAVVPFFHTLLKFKNRVP